MLVEKDDVPELCGELVKFQYEIRAFKRSLEINGIGHVSEAVVWDSTIQSTLPNTRKEIERWCKPEYPPRDTPSR